MGFSALPTALEQPEFIASAPVQHPLLHGIRFRHDPVKHRTLCCDLLVGHHVPVGVEHRDFRPPEKVLDQHRVVALCQQERCKRMTEAMKPEPLDPVSIRVIRTAVLHGDDPRRDRSRTEIIFHDHVPSPWLLSMQIRPAIGEIPTIAEIGMAALLPKADGSPKVVAVGGGRLAFEIDGKIIKDRKDSVSFLKEHAGVQL